jgi:hypothetical protein
MEVGVIKCLASTCVSSMFLLNPSTVANVVTSINSLKALDIGGPMTKQGNNVV